LDFTDFGFEVVEEGVVVVEARGHGERLFHHRGHGGAQRVNV
jgi:hypothetical protein